MSISYNTALVVGVRRKELPPEGEQWLDDDVIQSFAPYFDGNADDDAVCGLVVVDTYYSKEIDLVELLPIVDQKTKEFTKVTGLVGKLYLTLDIC